MKEERKLNDGIFIRAECGCLYRKWNDDVLMSDGTYGGEIIDPCEEHYDMNEDEIKSSILKVDETIAKLIK